MSNCKQSVRCGPPHGVRAAMALVLICVGGSAVADPPVIGELPDVFCFRVTDIERVGGDDNAFNFEFEVLNWTDQEAYGVNMAIGEASSVVSGGLPTITFASIDANGRGGPTGGSDIPLAFDNPAHQSGRGRGDVVGLENDWSVAPADVSATMATWRVAGAGTPVPNRDLVGFMISDGPSTACSQVPNGVFNSQTGVCDTTGLDSVGDIGIDGGPGVTPNPVSPDGSGNVLDGFVLTVDDFDEGEILSLNWFLLGDDGEPIGTAGGSAGTPARGNAFGFGTFNLGRFAAGSPLTGPAVFEGNSGLGARPYDFFGTVYQVPNPTLFLGEFGPSLTGEFLNPGDNIYDAEINAVPQEMPAPTTLALCLAGLAGIGAWRRRQ